MPLLTFAQKLKQTERQAQHLQRQARMPPHTRPRMSPKANLPGRVEGVLPDKLIPMRTCVERPESHPNDFRYLFRLANRPKTDPVYVWLNIDGQNPGNATYATLFSAIEAMVKAGWEDASW